jgi:tRNA-2-methylthio-N6-dimethylallyladenosine synthase
MKQVHIATFGCQMNENDSRTIARLLASCDYRETEEMEKADLILVNTCSIRQKAEEKVYSLLGRLRALKKKNPNLLIGVGGCVAQQEGERLLDRVPHLDLVFGTRLIQQLPNLLKEVGPGKGRLSRVDMEDVENSPYPLADFSGLQKEIKSSVTIMRGCDNHCAYCVVPYVRGPEESRLSTEIISEAEILAARGIKEILLLGQNVNSYGRHRSGELSFAQLLLRLESIPGLDRVRFTTSHPKDLSPELIDCFGTVSNLCEHIHLPVQSGSNRILDRMNRRYTREDYLDKIGRLKSQCPGIAISGDFIVGFPGETEDDFDQTMEVIRTVQYDDLFSFKYSDRPMAPSRNFSGKVDEEEKGRRLKELQAYQKKVTLSRNQALEGTIQEILVEGGSKKSSQEWMGRTRTNKIINFSGPAELVGRIVLVRIERAYVHSLRGVLL